MEHQLGSKQRRAVRAAHAHMRLYDVGWRRNVEQVFGMRAKRRWQAWVGRLLWGGGWYVRRLFISAPLLVLFFSLILAPRLVASFFFFSAGTGTQFPRNPRADDVLAELATELVRLEHGTD